MSDWECERRQANNTCSTDSLNESSVSVKRPLGTQPSAGEQGSRDDRLSKPSSSTTEASLVITFAGDNEFIFMNRRLHVSSRAPHYPELT